MMVILDNIRSVHNVGSIFRTSDAVGGIEKIVLCGVTPGPVDRFHFENKQFTKVSLGAEKSISWERVATTHEAVHAAKDAGLRVVAVELDRRAVSVYDHTLARFDMQRAALVLGSETQGLPADVLDAADCIVQIPMRGMKESLNVAVAYGIVVYHLTQGRSA